MLGMSGDDDEHPANNSAIQRVSEMRSENSEETYKEI